MSNPHRYPCSLPSVPTTRWHGTDGKLHGYRWGLHRKQGLLKNEKKQN